MVVYDKERLPQGMDHVGKKLRYHPCVLCFSEWVPRGAVDSSTEGSETRMPTCTSTICASDRCSSHVYNVSVLARLVDGIPDAELPRGDCDAAIWG